jgi:predicted nucleic acid-binding protein
MRKFSSGEIPLTKFFTSDYIFDETVTVIECVLGRHDLAVKVGEALRSSPRTEILSVDRDISEASWKLFESSRGLSFTDCTSLVLISEFGIQAAFTFDRHLKASGVGTIP